MHLKVVNSTNINDPLTIFESQQFQNRQTDSKKQQQVVCMHFPTLADVFIMRWKMAILHDWIVSIYSTWLERIKSSIQLEWRHSFQFMMIWFPVSLQHTCKIYCDLQNEVEKWPGVGFSILICLFWYVKGKVQPDLSYLLNSIIHSLGLCK